jgi:branched-chain amino acid transport system ATP-binding protein
LVVASGTALLLVEQNVRLALEMAERGYVLAAGRIVAAGSTRQLADEGAIHRAYLGSVGAPSEATAGKPSAAEVS